MKNLSTRKYAIVLLIIFLEQSFLAPLVMAANTLSRHYVPMAAPAGPMPPLNGRADKLPPPPVHETSAMGHKGVQKSNLKGGFKKRAGRGKGGPSTPEVQAFTPSTVENLVDPFTGDFTYNIKLMDVGGYPVNLTYRSGIGLNDEASWVGLGWNINPGAINRQVRGLPDDFKGENITQSRSQKKNETIAVSTAIDVEIFGAKVSKIATGKLGLRIGGEYNTFEGWSISAGVHPGISASASKKNLGRLTGSVNLAAGIDSRKGGYFSVNQSGSVGSNTNQIGAGLGINISSREGLKSITYGASYSASWLKSIPVSMSQKMDFAYPTFVPSFEMPMRSAARAFSASLGIEAWGINPHFNMSGSYSFEALAVPVQKKSAFGYLYTQKAPADALTDINREKDGVFRIENPVLGITNFTYDLYQVNAQGLSGMFRPMRGDIGILSDPTFRNNGKSDDFTKLFQPASYDLDEGDISAGVEVSVGNLTHIGIDQTQQSTTETQGKWEQGNALAATLKFEEAKPAEPGFEPIFFKNIGEVTVLENKEKFETLGKFGALAPKLSPTEGQSENNLTGSTSSSIREPRSTVLSWLTNEEASKGTSFYLPYRQVNRVDDPKGDHPVRMPNHIGVMNVTRDDGTRYEFGLPAYNVKQEETSFSIDSNNVKTPDGTVGYSAAENSTQNKSGKSNYFSKTETPPYAYAYLLTGLYSSDYVDVLNDGPTSDDLGTYTRFDYVRNQSDFKWRNPSGVNKAIYQENERTDRTDDMASYTYGEKEVWYLYQIGTRNYFAQFFTSEREDALGVLENGGIDRSKRLRKLDKIVLYTAASLGNPLQTVFFEYDYSLCKGVDNHVTQNGGKLTLKRVYSTYGSSEKGKETSYYFQYDNKPDWRGQDFDRWGNYKRDPGGAWDNRHFPYTPQNKVQADVYASAWHLSSIQTPGGGILKIDYESDDYANVQDKTAGVMAKVLGFSSSKEDLISKTTLFSSPTQQNRYLFFELQSQSVTGSNVYEYVKNIEHLYFNLNIKPNPATPGYEDFQGFVSSIKFNREDFGNKFGFRSENGVNIGWVLLPPAPYHPISLACWMQMMKTNPQSIYNAAPLGAGDTKNFGAAIKQFFNQISTLGEDFKTLALNGGYCSTLNPDNLGFIRLNQVTGRKFGGGSRVKAITIEDRWGNLTTGQDNGLNFDYGQTFQYTLPDGKSSGVALWEPLIGGDENPWMTPINFPTRESAFASPVDQFITNPVGESFFPAPSVGYSRVVVRNKAPENVGQHATGFTVQEFYTAKDFPTFASYTPLQVRRSELYLPLFVYVKRDNKATATQGFVVELNNMHGQPKSTSVYSAAETLVSSIEYEYYRDPVNGKLVNENIPVINPKTGVVEPRYMGIDYDFTVDARETKSNTLAVGIDVNTDGFLASFIPIYLPIPYPNIMEGESSLRTLTYTKVIHRKGILKGVRVFQNGATLYTENLAFDGLTGQALVTAVPDEFGQLQYTTVLPAHWNTEYANMGPAYVNAESRLENVVVSSNGQVSGSTAGWFRQGDQWLLFLPENNPERRVSALRAWVYRVDAGNAILINEAGQTIPPGTYKAVLYLSGNRNMQSEQMASYLTAQNPIAGGRLRVPTDSIINASVQTFSDFWHTYQAFNPEIGAWVCGKCTINASNPGFLPLAGLILALGKAGRLDEMSEGPIPNWVGHRYVSVTTGGVLSGSIINTATNEACGFEFYSTDNNALPDTAVIFTPRYPSTCTDGDEMIFTVGKREFRLRTDCFPLKNCEWARQVFANPVCGLATGTLNPFFNGILGIWRPLATYRFVADRQPSDWQGTDGLINGFRDFWQWGNGGIIRSADAPTYWQRADSAAVFSPYGHLLEMRNALQQPTATLYGYGYSLPIATATNARYHDVGCINFEDYINPYQNAGPMTAAGACLLPAHWTVNRTDYSKTNSTISHTGMSSLQLTPNSVVRFDRTIYPLNSWARKRAERVVGSNFTYDPSDLIKPFSPATGQTYIANGWVRGTTLGSKPLFIVIGTSRYELLRVGPMIEGWQQYQVEFILPTGSTAIGMELRSEANDLWFDDLRIHPFDASMESYVYDPVSLRLMAKMDVNNYATFYEYDKEGNLARTKKETERGIVTLQEVRSAQAKIKVGN